MSSTIVAMNTISSLSDQSVVRFAHREEFPHVARSSLTCITSGWSKLIFADLSLEVCVAFPAIIAANKGRDHTSPWMPVARSVKPNVRLVCCG
jgi:hypothetical protein